MRLSEKENIFYIYLYIYIIENNVTTHSRSWNKNEETVDESLSRGTSQTDSKSRAPRKISQRPPRDLQEAWLVHRNVARQSSRENSDGNHEMTWRSWIDDHETMIMKWWCHQVFVNVSPTHRETRAKEKEGLTRTRKKAKMSRWSNNCLLVCDYCRSL